MKTAALVLGLGLGCAAAGLPGDAAAGQPLEKRLERARRLSADACATETTTFSTCLADASITFTPATPAGPWASCADVQAEVAGICAAGPAACEVEYHTYTECLYEYMLTSSYGASCDLTCASSTRTPAPTPADFRDLDGDGANLCGNQTSVSGAPDNSSLSHFSATRPCWPRRAVRNRHRHAVEQASRRWRGGRRDDSARTRRKF